MLWIIFKALLKCIKILPGEILDRKFGQSVETGDCSNRSKQLQQLISELVICKLNSKWNLCVGDTHLKTEPIHTYEPICKNNKGP